jgi:hypothetical protein
MEARMDEGLASIFGTLQSWFFSVCAGISALLNLVDGK